MSLNWIYALQLVGCFLLLNVARAVSPPQQHWQWLAQLVLIFVAAGLFFRTPKPDR